MKYGLTQREMEYLTPVQKVNRTTKNHWLTRWTAIAILAIVIIISAFIHWSEWKASVVEAAYDTYDQCVQDTYGVSAVEFYQVYGKEAKCK